MFTLNSVRRLAKSAVDLRGYGFKYPNEWRDPLGMCKYVHNKKRACIIGVMFPAIKFVEDVNANVNLKPYLTIRARYYCTQLQLLQDGGKSWGEAYDVMEEIIANDMFPNAVELQESVW